MEEIKLRPYQEKFISDICSAFQAGHKRVCGVAPCGAGKTIMTGWLIREYLKQNMRIIFFVHRQELIEQTSKTFTQLGIEHGIISAGLPTNYELPVQIASVQTLSRRLNTVPKPDFLVCDECHHILAETYKSIVNKWSDALLLGVTATPQRMGGINLGDIFTSLVEAPTTGELIELGNLTPFTYYAPPDNLNMKKVRVKFGEYVNSDLEREMSNSKILGNIVFNYKEIAMGKSAICYCVNVRHSKKVAAAFNSAGIPAEHCDGETNKKVRAQIVEDFRLGKIKILCNAELFGEGFDVPNMQAVILARPTKSLTLYTQQSLRPLRPDPNEPDKRALIIDHVRNYSRFGLPTEDRKWSLAPNPPKKEIQHAPVGICPSCHAVIPLGCKTCPVCKYQLVTEEDEERRLVESDAILTEVKALLELEEAKRKFEEEKGIPVLNDHYKPRNERPKYVRQPTTPEEFLEIAKERNYKIGWVAIQSLEHAKSYDDCVHIAKICGYKEGWAWYKWKDIEAERKEKKFNLGRNYSSNQKSYFRG